MQTLLRESLLLWGVPGDVEDGGEGVVLRAAGRVIRVARGRAARWVVSAEEGGERGCASAAGVLSAVRALLEVEGGPALRIAPGSGDA